MADGRSQGAESLHVIAKSILQLVPKRRSVNICEPCRGITRRCLGCGDTCDSYGFSKLRSLWEGCIPMDPEWRIVSKRFCRLGVPETWITVPGICNMQSRSRNLEHMVSVLSVRQGFALWITAERDVGDDLPGAFGSGFNESMMLSCFLLIFWNKRRKKTGREIPWDTCCTWPLEHRLGGLAQGS